MTPRYVIESGDGRLLAETDDSLFLTLRTLLADGEPFPVQITDRRHPTMPIVGVLNEKGVPVVRS